MIQSGPVQCQYLQDSYHHSLPAGEGRLHFCFVLEGSATVHLDGIVLDLNRPGAFIFPSLISFTLRGRGRSRLLDCPLPFISKLTGHAMGASLSGLLPSAGKGPFRAFHLSAHSVLRLESLLDIIREETSLKRSDYLDMVQFQLFEILILLRREGPLSREALGEWSRKQRNWQIDDLAGYLAANYDSSFTLEELASRCNLNPSYLSRAFREKTGQPLFEYINRLRIERALQLLRNSDMTILDIAMSVGYNNISFFNRYFRKLKGCSPGEYRKRIAK